MLPSQLALKLKLIPDILHVLGGKPIIESCKTGQTFRMECVCVLKNIVALLGQIQGSDSNIYMAREMNLMLETKCNESAANMLHLQLRLIFHQISNWISHNAQFSEN